MTFRVEILLALDRRAERLSFSTKVNDVEAVRNDMRYLVKFAFPHYEASIRSFLVQGDAITGIALQYERWPVICVICSYIAFCNALKCGPSIHSIFQFVLHFSPIFQTQSTTIRQLCVCKRYSCSNACKLFQLLAEFTGLESHIVVGSLERKAHCWFESCGHEIEVAGSLAAGSLIVVADAAKSGYLAKFPNCETDNSIERFKLEEMIPLPKFLMREDALTPRVRESLMEKYKQKSTTTMLKKAIQYENYLKICKSNNEKLSEYKRANENELVGALRRQQTKNFGIMQVASNRTSSQHLVPSLNAEMLGKPACLPIQEFDIAKLLSDDEDD